MRAGSCLLLLLALAGCGEQASVSARAAAVPAGDPDSLSARLIPQDDLPPPGTRSLFDHLIREEGALPYPFENLIALLASHDRDGRAPVALLIPDGRSLLKGQADFARPRIIVAADARPAEGATLDPYLRGRLFLGFVEGASEIEVISYNEQAGRFEFQLVKDYREGAAPRIVYARRAICTTCHAGGAPIFPVRPWEETSGQPQIGAAMVRARAATADARYHGVPLQGRLSAPEAVDELAELANTLPTIQRVWLDGCGDGADGRACRRLLLRLALRYLLQPAEFGAGDTELRQLAELQRPHWPAQGIALANGDLPNRNPFVDRPRTGFGQWLRGLLPARGQEGDAKLGQFERLPPLRPELDPLTPRTPKARLQPGAPEAVTGLAQLFSAGDRRLLEQASDYEFARIGRVLAQPAFDALLQPAPFRRTPVMQALLAGLGHPAAPACCVGDEGMSPPVAEGVKPLAIAEGSVLKLYEHYCFGCHRGNPAARLDFMNGGTEAEVLARIRDTSAIREALDYERYLGSDKAVKLMPPADSWQRRELDRARAAGQDDVAKMLEAVPGLFDF